MPRGAGRRVSFVIPVRDDAVRLGRCLHSIRAGRYPQELVELVVVNNGSTDDSASVAAAQGATVLSVRDGRLGALRNRGVAASTGDVIAFVDADHEIGPDWVSSAVDALADDPVGAVGASCTAPQPGTWVQRLYDRLRRHVSGQQVVDWLGSGNMAVTRQAFDAARGFDESLETCEDVDLCRKLRACGYTILADGRLDNVHYGDPKTLRDVFLGELWRGRDNVRVSLRTPRSWRTLASAAVPVLSLFILLVALAGLLSVTGVGSGVSAWSALILLVLVGVRTARMVARDSSWRDVPGAFSVAAAYELGRALAVAARFGYDRRRRGAAM